MDILDVFESPVIDLITNARYFIGGEMSFC